VKADLAAAEGAGREAGGREAVAVDRLEEVIHRFQLEGLDGELVERGGEDDMGRVDLVFAKTPDHAKAVESGHLDIQEGQGRVEPLDKLKSFKAVGGHADYLDVADFVEEEAKFFPGELFVVCNDCGHRAGRR